jgi:Mn-containing catalase
MLNNGPDTEANEAGGADITQAPFKAMQDIRLAAQFFSAGGGALPMNSGGHSWNLDHVTTTGNVVFDLLHNFHLECGARVHKLRVYETLTEPTGREVCGYLLVRGSVHAHAYALALNQLTGADVTKILPTPNINLDRIPEARKYTAEGVHRRLYRFSPSDYHEIEAILGRRRARTAGGPAGRAGGAGRPTGGRQDPRPHRHGVGLRARLCARGDVRDRDETLQESQKSVVCY